MPSPTREELAQELTYQFGVESDNEYVRTTAAGNLTIDGLTPEDRVINLSLSMLRARLMDDDAEENVIGPFLEPNFRELIQQTQARYPSMMGRVHRRSCAWCGQTEAEMDTYYCGSSCAHQGHDREQRELRMNLTEAREDRDFYIESLENTRRRVQELEAELEGRTVTTRRNETPNEGPSPDPLAPEPTSDPPTTANSVTFNRIFRQEEEDRRTRIYGRLIRDNDTRGEY